ncbi:MAG: hypothetical protein ACM3NQ_14810 [Bacteroidales bacterium]
MKSSSTSGVRRSACIALVALAAVGLAPRTASADATAFLGFSTSPSTRAARGFAVGFSLVVVGFEFEYGSSSEDPPSRAPSLRTGSFNGLVQTPFEIARMQIYGTLGAGVFREVLDTNSETNLAVNFGGGVKMRIYGPIRLRIDYRAFRLNGSALYPHPQRLYAGLNLKF